MRVEVRMASPEPAVGVFTSAGTRQGRLPGLRRAAEGLVVPSAPVHASGGLLAWPHVIGLAIPNGDAGRSRNHQRQGTADGPDPQALAAHRHDGAHTGHHAWSRADLGIFW